VIVAVICVQPSRGKQSNYVTYGLKLTKDTITTKSKVFDKKNTQNTQCKTSKCKQHDICGPKVARSVEQAERMHNDVI